MAVAQSSLSGALPFLPPALDASVDEASGVLTGPAEGDPAVSPDDFKALLGYSGPLYNPEAQSGSVKVLSGTLRRGAGSSWRMLGLVRNETQATVRDVTVTATLRSIAGDVLGTVSALSPVKGARPGEPVPFSLSSEVSSSAVADVQYSAAGTPGTVPVRDLSTSVLRREPFGDRARLDSFPFTDPVSGPYPYVLFGQIENLGTVPVTPTAVGAWLDSDNHVLATAELSRITIAEAADEPVTETGSLGPGEQGLFLYSSSDPDVAPSLADAEFVVWTGGESS